MTELTPEQLEKARKIVGKGLFPTLSVRRQIDEIIKLQLASGSLKLEDLK